jgi:uncharacterized protein YkwD
MMNRCAHRAMVAAVTVALTVTSTPALAKGTAKPVHKTETVEHALVHWVNVQRQHQGLPPLAPAADLTAVAHRHTATMAKGDRVFHDPALGKKVHGYVSLGEDVGSAATVAALEKAFLTDAHNRANLLGQGFRHIGVGTKTHDGLLYVTILTRRPLTATQH